MEASEPFFSPERKESAKTCFIRFRFLKNSEKCSGIGGEGLEAIRNQAPKSQVNIPFELKEHNFTEVLNRLNKQNDTEKIIVHTSCRVSFRNNIRTFQERYGLINLSESSSEENTRTLSSDSPFKHATRSAVGIARTLEKKCFTCNESRTVDNEAYNNGGLAKITCEDTADKTEEQKNIFVVNKESRFFQAAKRLDILLSGSAHDVFSAGVFYHQSCYIRFFVKPVKLPSRGDLQKSKAEAVLDLFKYRIKTKIIKDKEAYLLHELLKDVKYLSEEYDFETPVIEHTSSLKRYLVQEYSNGIAFVLSGKSLLVHPIDINPCTYSTATLHSCGLRETDLTKAFGRMLSRKLQERQKYGIT